MTREPKYKDIYTLTTKAGTVTYDSLNDVVEFILNNPVDFYSVKRNNSEFTQVVSAILEYRRNRDIGQSSRLLESGSSS
jgi:hypothetical protein